MKYEVLSGTGENAVKVAVKDCMDDALDLIRELSKWDDEIGWKEAEDWYKVRIVKE